MKNLEKFKIAPQTKFVKFKVKSSSPPECVPTLALEVWQLPTPCLADDTSPGP